MDINNIKTYLDICSKLKENTLPIYTYLYVKDGEFIYSNGIIDVKKYIKDFDNFSFICNFNSFKSVFSKIKTNNFSIVIKDNLLKIITNNGIYDLKLFDGIELHNFEYGDILSNNIALLNKNDIKNIKNANLYTINNTTNVLSNIFIDKNKIIATDEVKFYFNILSNNSKDNFYIPNYICKILEEESCSVFKTNDYILLKYNNYNIFYKYIKQDYPNYKNAIKFDINDFESNIIFSKQELLNTLNSCYEATDEDQKVIIINNNNIKTLGENSFFENTLNFYKLTGKDINIILSLDEILFIVKNVIQDKITLYISNKYNFILINNNIMLNKLYY